MKFSVHKNCFTFAILSERPCRAGRPSFFFKAHLRFGFVNFAEKYLAVVAQLTSPKYGLQRLKFIFGNFPFVNFALVLITLFLPNNLLVLIALHYLMFVEDGYVGEVRMTMMLA